MRRIKASDCRTFPVIGSKAFQAVLDFDHYAQWWPQGLSLQVLQTTPNHVGSQIEVRPFGGRFVCEIASVVEDQEIVIHYVDGLHRGIGVWTFEKTEAGTHVCYRIDLEPQGFLPRLLSGCMDFGKMHSSQMEHVFDGLERWLTNGMTESIQK